VPTQKSIHVNIKLQYAIHGLNWYRPKHHFD